MRPRSRCGIANSLILDKQAAAGGSELSIQTATWRDLRPIVALEAICFGHDSWPWLEILAALTFPGTIRLKAELRGQIVGFVIGDRKGGRDVGWVASLGVHPDYRRRGFGRRLLQTCEQELQRRIIRLSLRKSNEAALVLYRQSGYAQVDFWPRYYRDGEDALVMERVLTA